MVSNAHKTGNEVIEASAARARADEHMRRVRDVAEVTGEFPIQQGYSKEFFQAFKVERHWKENNAALKWFRENAELAPFNDRPVVFGNDSTLMMPRIKKSTGPDWRFDIAGGRIVPWTWQSMVAHLDDPSIECVVNGVFDSKEGSQTSAVATSSGDQQPDQQQRTIVGCELAAKEDPNYKRHPMQKKQV